MDRLVITLPVEDGLHLVAHARGTAYCGIAIEPHMLGCRKEWDHTDKPRCLRCELEVVRADRRELAGLLRESIRGAGTSWFESTFLERIRVAIKRWG